MAGSVPLYVGSLPYEVQKRKLDSLFDSAIRVNKIDKFDRDSLHER
jgi:hypothetical protein